MENPAGARYFFVKFQVFLICLGPDLNEAENGTFEVYDQAILTCKISSAVAFVSGGDKSLSNKMSWILSGFLPAFFA